MPLQSIDLKPLTRQTDKTHITALLSEYLHHINTTLSQKYDILLDIGSIISKDLAPDSRFYHPKNILLLAYYNGEPAGTAALESRGDSIAEIQRIYVRPFFQKKGIGRRLLTRLIEEAMNRGYDRLRLETLTFLKPAQALYESMGFEIVNEGVDPLSDHAHEVRSRYADSVVVMEKKLALWTQKSS